MYNFKPQSMESKNVFQSNQFNQRVQNYGLKKNILIELTLLTQRLRKNKLPIENEEKNVISGKIAILKHGERMLFKDDVEPNTGKVVNIRKCNGKIIMETESSSLYTVKVLAGQ